MNPFKKYNVNCIPRILEDKMNLVDSNEVSGFELLRLDKAGHREEVGLPDQCEIMLRV